MIEKTGPTIYKGESIYNTGAGGGGGGGIGDIVNYFTLIDGVIPSSSNYNIIDLGQDYNAQDTTIEFSFYETINLNDTNGNFANICGIDGAYWVELLGHGGGSHNLRFRINGSTYLPTMWPLNKGLYKFVLNGSNCNLNGVNYNVNAPTNPVHYVRIGCNNTGGNYSVPAIKEILTTVSGVIKSHLIAVKRLTDNKPALFDIVRGYFDNSRTYTEYTP